MIDEGAVAGARGGISVATFLRIVSALSFSALSLCSAGTRYLSNNEGYRVEGLSMGDAPVGTILRRSSIRLLSDAI